MPAPHALHDLPFHVAETLRAELQQGETLLWCAQPLPGRVVRATIPVVLFGIVVLSFAIFWVWSASGGPMGHDRFMRPPQFFPLCGTPFILVGLVMVLSPLWARRTASRTVYAITSKGALLIEGSFFGARTVKRYGPDRFADLERHERADGSGDLIFEHEVSTRRCDDRHGSHVVTHPRGFLAVPDVRHAEQVLRSVAAPQ